MKVYDVIIIGGGQSGLATAYYLRRTSLSFLILDREKEPGGSWQRYWHSLRLFSPAQWSSLPGVIMPGGSRYYPTRDETLEYIRAYEARYRFPVKRPAEVSGVFKEGNLFVAETADGFYKARTIVSATGSFANPYVPPVPGAGNFRGKIIHSSEYRSPEEFAGQRVAIVGEGNSGAQILAEVSLAAETLWIAKNRPRFLPDHIDGRYLFDAATRLYEARKAGRSYEPPSLGDIVMVPPVKEARERGVLKHISPFQEFGTDRLIWQNGHEEPVDAVIFCTGFKPALQHLTPLNLPVVDQKVRTAESRSLDVEGLWLVGYGGWTGFASATLIGVGRSAKKTAEEIQSYLEEEKAW